MNSHLEATAELFRQLAFISALIGGFSLTFLTQLISTHPERRIVGWTIGFSMAAVAGLTVCVLGWTLSATVINDPAALPEMARLSVMLTRLHKFLSLGFIASILLFLVSLGLCGWIRSRAMGIVSTVIALAAAAAALSVLRLFIS